MADNEIRRSPPCQASPCQASPGQASPGQASPDPESVAAEGQLPRPIISRKEYAAAVAPLSVAGHYEACVDILQRAYHEECLKDEEDRLIPSGAIPKLVTHIDAVSTTIADKKFVFAALRRPYGELLRQTDGEWAKKEGFSLRSGVANQFNTALLSGGAHLYVRMVMEDKDIVDSLVRWCKEAVARIGAATHQNELKPIMNQFGMFPRMSKNQSKLTTEELTILKDFVNRFDVA